MTKKKPLKLIILGACGEGKCIADFVADINKSSNDLAYELLGFLDDNTTVHTDLYYGLPVLGALKDVDQYPEVKFINAIGSYSYLDLRAEIYSRLDLPHERYETIIHPNAQVSPSAVIGHGCVIYPFVTIGPSARIGNQVMALYGVNLSHDCDIGNFVIMAGGAQVSGFCKIGESSYLGALSSIREKLSISSSTLVGMGSAVIHSIVDSGTYVGVPARRLTTI